MGQNGGFMTAKAISKRIKAKGLGRLRWYCQMCEKQCRDENGFKCHTQSAGHQRQLAIFGENPTEYISKFSTSFRRGFLTVLRQRYGTSMVNANSVYQEYIKDRDHVHMNATQWTTLSDFAKHLGKVGLCKVEDRDDGFWVSFVDREVAEKDREARERDTRLLEEEHRAERILQYQINTTTRDPDLSEPADTVNPENDQTQSNPLTMRISARYRAKFLPPAPEENALQSLSNHHPFKQDPSPSKRNRSKLESQDPLNLMPMQVDDHEKGVEKGKEDAPWLHKNIFVKVKNGQVASGMYRGKKGKVVDVIDEYGARVSMLDSDAVLELDQDDLETVIPKPGGVVLLLRGPRRGQKAVIRNVNVDHFNVTLSMLDTGEQLDNIEYEMVSRV